MNRHYKSAFELYEKELAEHQLELVCEGPVTAYYLKKPGEGRMMSCLIVFTPEGIVIQGDFTPGRNGNVSVYGYGIRWFSGQLSPDYLAEKFLKTKWIKDIAEDALTDPNVSWLLESYPEKAEDFARLAERLDDMGSEVFYHELSDLGVDVSDGTPGWTYDPQEQALLSAIQQRFAALVPAGVR